MKKNFLRFISILLLSNISLAAGFSGKMYSDKYHEMNLACDQGVHVSLKQTASDSMDAKLTPFSEGSSCDMEPILSGPRSYELHSRTTSYGTLWFGKELEGMGRELRVYNLDFKKDPYGGFSLTEYAKNFGPSNPSYKNWYPRY